MRKWLYLVEDIATLPIGGLSYHSTPCGGVALRAFSRPLRHQQGKSRLLAAEQHSQYTVGVAFKVDEGPHALSDFNNFCQTLSGPAAGGQLGIYKRRPLHENVQF